MTMADNNDDMVRLIGGEMKLAYNFAQAVDILLNTIDRRVRAHGAGRGLRRERKQAFRRWVESVTAASRWFSVAFEGELEAATCGDWRKLDGYRQDANELIRMAMLYIDRTSTYGAYHHIMEVLQSMPEGGIFSEEDVRRYEFTAKCRMQPVESTPDDSDGA